MQRPRKPGPATRPWAGRCSTADERGAAQVQRVKGQRVGGGGRGRTCAPEQDEPAWPVRTPAGTAAGKTEQPGLRAVNVLREGGEPRRRQGGPHAREEGDRSQEGRKRRHRLAAGFLRREGGSVGIGGGERTLGSREDVVHAGELRRSELHQTIELIHIELLSKNGR